MSEAIFGTEAPKFWERNLPVIPLNGKVPIQTGWQGNLGAIPNEASQTALVAAHPNNNIGLLLGPSTGDDRVLTALDVDDDRLVKLALQFLGLNRKERRAALSGKRGKKGATIFARAPKTLKSTTIKGAGGLGNVDFLAAGKQTVMPASIHPETNKPYEVYGTSLLEVDLTTLPEISERHIQLLKAAIGSEHAIVLASGEATHDAGVAFVATLVRGGATDEEITDVFTGLLPENYDGDSLKELPEWIKSAREKGFDEPQGEGNSLTKALVTLAIGSGVVLFNDGDENAFATLPDFGSSIAVRLNSSRFSMWLRHLAHTVLGRSVSSGPLKEAVATLEAQALFDGPKLPVYVRVAGDNERVVIDTGQPGGNVVNIDRDGWEVSTETTHRFVRGAGFLALPPPQKGGDLASLRSFLGLDEQNYRLLIAFLVTALRPHGPYFALLIEGEQGSGKSFFCEVVKRVIDPNQAMRLRLPDNPQDLMIHAKEYRLLSYDNASGMKAEMSDVLCTLSTGGGYAVRKLYSDGDLYVMSYTRPFMINGISGYASRPDLMERAIPIRLSPMPEGGRKTEDELREEFEKLLPSLLGALYDAISHALRHFDEVEPPRHIRMADAARWVKAAEKGMGEKDGDVIDAIALAQNEFLVDQVNNDPLVFKLKAVTRFKPFEGHVAELFVKMTEDSSYLSDRGLPKTPAHLSTQLKRLRPAMAIAGVKVEFLDRDRKGRRIKVTSEPDETGSLKI